MAEINPPYLGIPKFKFDENEYKGLVWSIFKYESRKWPLNVIFSDIVYHCVLDTSDSKRLEGAQNITVHYITKYYV